jgi:hypothetical protein
MSVAALSCHSDCGRGRCELRLFEDEFHQLNGKEGIAGLEVHPYMADWVRDALAGKHPADLNRIVVVKQKSGAGPYDDAVSSVYLPEREG